MSNERDRTRQLITEAIFSHIRWRERVEYAIQRKLLDESLDSVSDDKICSFGLWLYSEEVPLSMRASSYYPVICKMHKDFHQKSGDIITIMRENKVDEFSVIFREIHEYNNLSDALVKTMEVWWQDSE